MVPAVPADPVVPAVLQTSVFMEREKGSERMKRVLITGASRGIGYSTAAIFLKHGYSVIGTSRNAPLHDELFPDADCFRMVSLDLTSAESIEALYENGRCDIVIHNAG